ncbi:MAG: hypothetical protein LBL07_11260 [Tannerella sp.]|nr:hypothetical protein [Tannerella sp.]
MERENCIQMVKSQYNTEGKKCYAAYATIKKGGRRQTLKGYVVDDLYFIDTEQKQIRPTADFYLINNLEEDEGCEL